MKRLTRTLPLILAAALQLVPLLRNIVTSPAAGSSFAFILRWGIGSAAAIGTVDAVSGATNSFALPSNYNGTNNVFFTNNLTLTAKTDGDGGTKTLCTVLTNGVVAALVYGNHSTTNGMPVGLTLKFVDIASGTPSFSNVYCVVSGTPTRVGTNSFHLDLTYPGANAIAGNFTIAILAASGGSAPTITNQPVSVTNNVGTSATFSVTNGGTAPFTYQWYYNTNSPLLNQTNISLTLTNLQLTNAGTYSVAITNAVGSTNSSFAQLTVWQPPIITNQPISVTNMAGGNATFTVGAGGVPSLAYQWSFNTNTALLNATNSSLTLTNVRAGQAGTYSVTITNAAGVTNSIFATLVVTNPPPPPLTAPVKSGGSFQFTFTPVIGLTNTVLTNSVLVGGAWNVFTNILPPATATPITITDVPGIPSLYYKVLVVP